MNAVYTAQFNIYIELNGWLVKTTADGVAWNRADGCAAVTSSTVGLRPQFYAWNSWYASAVAAKTITQNSGWFLYVGCYTYGDIGQVEGIANVGSMCTTSAATIGMLYLETRRMGHLQHEMVRAASMTTDSGACMSCARNRSRA